MLIEGLNALITSNAIVQEFIGTPATRKDKFNGVFPMVAPDECTLPYIVCVQIHRESVLSFAGVNRLQQARWQFSCYGGTYLGAKKLAQAVKQLLDGFQGRLTDADQTIVYNIIPISEHDEPEPVFKGTVHGVILDYQIIFVDTTTLS